jgi:hypothetical protein
MKVEDHLGDLGVYEETILTVCEAVYIEKFI